MRTFRRIGICGVLKGVWMRRGRGKWGWLGVQGLRWRCRCSFEYVCVYHYRVFLPAGQSVCCTIWSSRTLVSQSNLVQTIQVCSEKRLTGDRSILDTREETWKEQGGYMMSCVLPHEFEIGDAKAVIVVCSTWTNCDHGSPRTTSEK